VRALTDSSLKAEWDENASGKHVAWARAGGEQRIAEVKECRNRAGYLT